MNSVAIVTGASRGIGRATVLRLARDFAAVVLVAREGEALRDVATLVKSLGAEPLVVDLDLSKVESGKTVIQHTLSRFGRIDALLNIAGAVPQIDLFEMTDEQWHAGMELILHGARRLTILAWEALTKSKGSVVFMSGSASLDPKPAFAAVAATNAAITALAKAFASKALKTACRSTVLSGAGDDGASPLLHGEWAPAHNMSVEEAMKEFPREVGISRYGQPEEIANLLAFMVSPAAKWMTGTSVRMDGGEIKGI